MLSWPAEQGAERDRKCDKTELEQLRQWWRAAKECVGSLRACCDPQVTWEMMILLLLFFQKQSLAFDVYLFGIGTLLTRQWITITSASRQSSRSVTRRGTWR